MNKETVIIGKDIKSICTRFFYKQDALCFQIVLNCENGQVLYKDFDDYHQYQARHNEVVEAYQELRELRHDYDELHYEKELV